MQLVRRVCSLLPALILMRSLAAEYHVAPDGLALGRGKLSSPLNLSKALSSGSPAKAGDTIWLHAGIYHGPFTSSLTGQPDKPIIVRQYPGERATIDCIRTN